MNKIFTVLKDEHFSKDILKFNLEQFESFKDVEIYIINFSNINIEDLIKNENLKIIIAPRDYSFYEISFYDTVIFLFNSIEYDISDKILINSCQNTIFLKNPFNFMDIFNKEYYFINNGQLIFQSNDIKNNFHYYTKTFQLMCNYPPEMFSINNKVISGNIQSIKFLSHHIKNNLNRLSAIRINGSSVLSEYVLMHKRENILYTNEIVDNYCKKIDLSYELIKNLDMLQEFYQGVHILIDKKENIF